MTKCAFSVDAHNQTSTQSFTEASAVITGETNGTQVLRFRNLLPNEVCLDATACDIMVMEVCCVCTRTCMRVRVRASACTDLSACTSQDLPLQNYARYWYCCMPNPSLRQSDPTRLIQYPLRSLANLPPTVGPQTAVRPRHPQRRPRAGRTARRRCSLKHGFQRGNHVAGGGAGPFD